MLIAFHIEVTGVNLTYRRDHLSHKNLTQEDIIVTLPVAILYQDNLQLLVGKRRSCP